MKALGVGLGAVDLADIGVVRQESGAPVLNLVGRARTRAEELGAHNWHVSLSHSDLIAQAFVVASSSDESAPIKTP